MNKEMTIRTNVSKPNFVQMAAKAVRMPVEMLCKYYSDVLERELNLRQTWLLINAQLAFTFAVLPFESPLFLRAAACIWFLHAVLKCREALK
ncbi:MAG: ATP-binding protein [Prevotella sp.]|nr:ATP-binding protein [Prevotella sp.]